jgi:hypothetical protein
MLLNFRDIATRSILVDGHCTGLRVVVSAAWNESQKDVRNESQRMWLPLAKFAMFQK